MNRATQGAEVMNRATQGANGANQNARSPAIAAPQLATLCLTERGERTRAAMNRAMNRATQGANGANQNARSFMC